MTKRHRYPQNLMEITYLRRTIQRMQWFARITLLPSLGIVNLLNFYKLKLGTFPRTQHNMAAALQVTSASSRGQVLGTTSSLEHIAQPLCVRQQRLRCRGGGRPRRKHQRGLAQPRVMRRHAAAQQRGVRGGHRQPPPCGHVRHWCGWRCRARRRWEGPCK